MKRLLLLPALALQFAGVACGGWFFYAAWVGILPHLFGRAVAVGSLGIIIFALGSGVADAVR